MVMPDWKNSGLGTMKRAALWLIQVVGEGNTFTKNQLRDDFPEVAQIDRRMRDLRSFGWKIHTNREDASLETHEQRFVERGTAVWEAGKGSSSSERNATITSSQRHAILMRDGHRCRGCGIGPGEKYVGTDMMSQLDIARRPVRLPDGRRETQLVIECNRCRIGNRGLVADTAGLLTRIEKLPAIEKRMLSSWIEHDVRASSAVEEIWALYLTLPAESRALVVSALA